jgi:hypothetical protein
LQRHLNSIYPCLSLPTRFWHILTFHPPCITISRFAAQDVLYATFVHSPVARSSSNATMIAVWMVVLSIQLSLGSILYNGTIRQSLPRIHEIPPLSDAHLFDFGAFDVPVFLGIILDCPVRTKLAHLKNMSISEEEYELFESNLCSSPDAWASFKSEDSNIDDDSGNELFLTHSSLSR